ncbi:MAG: hypothetical protein HXX16_17910 [Bacteroidales bacterium]|nr:hypothetical protein [Bacteroidales bacterium]
MFQIKKLFLIVPLFALIAISISCKKDYESYTIKGYVIDQITKKPVENATIRIGYIPFCDGLDEYLWPYGDSVNTKADGSFIIKVDRLPFDDYDHRCSYVYSKMNGYIGSDYIEAPKGGVLADTIELYHPATLNIHVINDTISNNIDEVKVCFAGEGFRSYPNFIGKLDSSGEPSIKKTCKGRKFDSTFVFNNIWGNINYNIYVGPSYISRTQSYSVKLRPDSTSEILIKF